MPILLFIPNVSIVYAKLGQQQEVVDFMQIYINCYLPGLFMYAMGDLQRRFLNSMGYTYVPLVCQFLSIGLHGFWLYLFTAYYDLGIYGIGLAGVITNTSSCLFMVVYSSFIKEI